jgi:hypothetical protein
MDNIDVAICIISSDANRHQTVLGLFFFSYACHAVFWIEGLLLEALEASCKGVLNSAAMWWLRCKAA